METGETWWNHWTSEVDSIRVHVETADQTPWASVLAAGVHPSGVRLEIFLKMIPAKQFQSCWPDLKRLLTHRLQPTSADHVCPLGACCCQPTTQFQIWCCPVQVSSFSPDPRLSKLQVSNSFWAEIDRRCWPDDMLGKSGSEVSNWQESFGSTAVWLGSVRLLVIISKKKHRRSTVYVPNQIICHWRCQNISRPGRSPEILPSLGKRMQTEKRLLLRRKKLMSNFKCPHIIVQSRPQSFIHTRKRSSGKWSHSQIRSNQIWFEMGRMDEVLLHRCNGLISYSYRIQALRSFMGLSTVMCYLHALIHAWGFTPGVCAFLVQRQSQSCCHYRDMHHVSMFAEFEPSWNKSNHVLQDPLADLKILRVAEQKAHVHLAVELTY